MRTQYHTTTLAKVFIALLVVAVAMVVAGFVLKATNEVFVFVACAGIALAVVMSILLFKEKDKFVITRPGEIDLPMGAKIGDVERKSGRIAVLFSELQTIEEENGTYIITKTSGSHVTFTMKGISPKAQAKIVEIARERAGK